MFEFKPRKLKFKAWDKEAGLLMRLDSIAFEKGELFRKDHHILQFTGFVDRHQEELYEMDVVLVGNDRYVIHWNTDEGRWCYSGEQGIHGTMKLTRDVAGQMVRICSYFESRRS